MLSLKQDDKKKMNVLVLGSDGVGWSIDSDRKNVIRLISQSRKFRLTKNIFQTDAVYSVWYNSLEKKHFFYPLKFLKYWNKTKILATVTNEIENTPEKIDTLKSLVDIWIAPSMKTMRYLEERRLHAIHIPFLIEKKVFRRLGQSKGQIAELLGIDPLSLSGKILIGSFQRDSLGSDLSKPKWQKDPDLLIKILRQLPRQSFILLLAGPRRHYIIGKCKEYNIPYLFVGDESFIAGHKDDIIENNLPLEKINLLYNLIDIYLVTSKSEGGPKAPLECGLTETLIFSTPVGLVPDVLDENLIYTEDTTDTLVKKIKQFTDNRNAFRGEMATSIQKISNALDEKTILSALEKKLYEH